MFSFEPGSIMAGREMRIWYTLLEHALRKTENLIIGVFIHYSSGLSADHHTKFTTNTNMNYLVYEHFGSLRGQGSRLLRILWIGNPLPDRALFFDVKRY